MRTDYDIFTGAERVSRIAASPIRTILDRAAALRAQGHKVLPLSAGEPNFNTPEGIKEAAIRALQANYTHYGSNRGLPKLRELLAAEITHDTGVLYHPETEILITSSGAEAINNTILTIVEEGDEVIVFTPAFVSYMNLIRMCGGIFVDIPLKPENNFQIDLSEVSSRITSRTKLIILNNPCNPTGAVYDPVTLEGLAGLAIKHNLLVVSDEMYSRLVYDDISFRSISSFPGMKERSVIINGFSKTYAMTGWRLGYITADERMINLILKVHQYSTTCSPTFLQVGLADSMTSSSVRAEVQGMIAEFSKRRNLIMQKLDSIPQLSYIRPFGAFYIMVDVSKTGLSGQEFATRLLEEKYVATVPAVGLGKECTNFIRISYAASDDDILTGMERIRDLTAELTDTDGL